MKQNRSSKNKTIILDENDAEKFSQRLISLKEKTSLDSILNKTIYNDFFESINYLPDNFIDLAIIDPPYNLNKDFGNLNFRKKSDNDYSQYIDSFIRLIIPHLRKTASIYVCCDLFSSSAVYDVLSKYFIVRNRITWQREKGRGAQFNWKNALEDIWFATVSNNYYFNIDAVKMKRRVIAPYREEGKPKDWQETEEGKFRLTHPSNFWDDISVPYWSMAENTTHPTQKPEKLIAKLILASSKEDDIVFDPFAGSGTTPVVANKLNRKYVSIEMDKYYALLTEYRLEKSNIDKNIQGFADGVFWERNTYSYLKSLMTKSKKDNI
ncbi:site-specific DNA-methyltransferase [Brachyspira sp. G79]|uniref:DNA-methyltransferase n=1 Tax=Brachyspira sp. G79 TaxID=1358104 RepID=UPI000BBCBD77|nr:site-specific DNA-methyltransferase [Brachyspira sp. G79]PCG20206.1 DNA methylase [Brachyspira sp. G79]